MTTNPLAETMTTAGRSGGGSVDRRTVLRVLGVTSGSVVSGCLSGDEDDADGNGDGAEGASDESADDDETGRSSDASTDGGSEESVGTAEIAFLGETYTYDDASCEGSTTFPPENEMIRHRDVDNGLEFWVERDDPAASDVVEGYLGFPEGGADETIGEIEAYTARTTVDEVEFELGRGTSGSLHLEPSHHMNDDVAHDPDGGEVTWEIAC
ncbi:hypothetical protein [Natronococcus jeotgali]|uniref:Uncharacterized protein n=1 Tax=Natronococcus jeotgali DSM 18795 TaxID=1227498 RepID=L9XJQ7_9EURY|nr:hypothetical protein [Natronococcus jeotgali]ELY60878.1 hypothetical protein C492_10270 [Natronococcus jeotgali DSM 18795]